MRIAYLSADPGVPVFGWKGCSVHVQEMLRALLNRDAEIELFAARQGGECPTDLSALRVHLIGEFCHPARSQDERSVHRANRALLNRLDASGPFDLVYERYSLWSYAGMEFASRAGIPGLLEVNAPLIEEQARYRRLAAPHLARHIAERAFGAAAVLCAVSSQVASYVAGFPMARRRIHVVPNGVDPARFGQSAKQTVAETRVGGSERPAPAAGSRCFTVGFVGSLKPWHGVSALVTAFARLYRADPACRLLIVGDGPERENLVGQLAAEPGGVLAATCLAGAVPSREIPQYLSRMDVAVAPYPDLEDFYFSPLKVFEYMAAALPVVVSRIGDLPRIICDGVNGILCTPGDAAELAGALDRLRRDPALCRRMGDAARATAIERHTWVGVARRVLSLAGVTEVSASEQSLTRAAHGPSAVVA